MLLFFSWIGIIAFLICLTYFESEVQNRYLGFGWYLSCTIIFLISTIIICLMSQNIVQW